MIRLDAMPLHQLYAACAVVIGLSAAMLAWLPRARRVYRGHGCWPLAQGLLAVGLGLASQRPGNAELEPVVQLLVLQWPIVALHGWRRFYARETWSTPLAADTLVLLLGFGAWLALWATTGSPDTAAATAAAAAATGHGYAALLLGRVCPRRRGTALRAATTLHTLLAAMLFACALPWPGEVVWAGLAMPLLAGGLTLWPLIALLATADRTERDLRQTNQRLQQLANIDVLTAIPNRRHFHELADETLVRLRHGRPQPATIALCDIDHFKSINDRLGHAEGDRALQFVARCLQGVLRAQDVYGRLGGDEFAMLLPGAGLADAMGVASRIVVQLDEQSRDERCSLSFGVVELHEDETVDDALRRADQALYEAKRQGRKRAVVATGDAARPLFGESRPLGLHPL